MKNIKPIVDWQDPETTPNVDKYSKDLFWIAVKSKVGSAEGEWRVFVYPAYFINKPLEYSEDDLDKIEPLDDDHHVDVDGYPVAAVGWHSELSHADFCNYYEKISFRDEYALLGWAEYEPPEFNI